MDNGPEEIGDVAEKTRVQRQARAVYAKSVLTSAILTALALAP
jgi:hypothetical protein